MLYTPFYDPEKTYEENFKKGPFGAFADGKIYKDKGEPKCEFLGQKIYLPFGIPSGPLINGNFVKAALYKGFDLVEYKDTRTRAFSCHPLPNIIPLQVKGYLTLMLPEYRSKIDKKIKEILTSTNTIVK